MQEWPAERAGGAAALGGDPLPHAQDAAGLRGGGRAAPTRRLGAQLGALTLSTASKGGSGDDDGGTSSGSPLAGRSSRSGSVVAEAALQSQRRSSRLAAMQAERTCKQQQEQALQQRQQQQVDEEDGEEVALSRQRARAPRGRQPGHSRQPSAAYSPLLTPARSLDTGSGGFGFGLLGVAPFQLPAAPACPVAADPASCRLRIAFRQLEGEEGQRLVLEGVAQREDCPASQLGTAAAASYPRWHGKSTLATLAEVQVRCGRRCGRWEASQRSTVHLSQPVGRRESRHICLMYTPCQQAGAETSCCGDVQAFPARRARDASPLRRMAQIEVRGLAERGGMERRGSERRAMTLIPQIGMSAVHVKCNPTWGQPSMRGERSSARNSSPCPLLPRVISFSGRHAYG